MLQPFHSKYNIPGSLSGLKDRPIMVTMATHLAEATTPAVSSSRSCCHQIFETSGDNHEEYLQSQEDWGQFPQALVPASWPDDLHTQEASRTTFRRLVSGLAMPHEGTASLEPTTPCKSPMVVVATGSNSPGCPTAGVPRPLQASGPQRP